MEPILKSFSNLSDTTEFSSEEGRLTLANFDVVSKVFIALFTVSPILGLISTLCATKIRRSCS